MYFGTKEVKAKDSLTAEFLKWTLPVDDMDKSSPSMLSINITVLCQ